MALVGKGLTLLGDAPEFWEHGLPKKTKICSHPLIQTNVNTLLPSTIQSLHPAIQTQPAFLERTCIFIYLLPPRSPAPHKKFSWKIQGPTKRTAMKPHGHFPNIIIIVQRSWCPSQGTGRARATCCRPRPSLSPLSCAQIHLLTLFFFCFCFFCCFVHPQFIKNIFHSMF